MLRTIVDKQIIVIALGIFTAAGIFSKCMVNAVLSRLVRAAGNMNKSNHPLMRLVRAKFEHACMVSEKVENVEVFVDKYLYSYKVLGIGLHSLRRLEKASALLCIVTGLLGAVATYRAYGMNDLVLQTGVIGAGLGILVYVFHLTTDENYRMQMARNYMVDYLQNVCLHRYEKAHQKEMDEKTPAGWEQDEEEAGREEYAGEGFAAEIDEDEFEETDMVTEAAEAAEAQARAAKPERMKASGSEKSVKLEASGQERAKAGRMEAAKAQAAKKRNLNDPEPTRPRPGKEVPSPQMPPEILPPAMPEPYPVPDTNREEKDRVRAAAGRAEKEEPEGTEQKSVEREILIRQILEEFMA